MRNHLPAAQLLKATLALPTAPFHESHVVRFIEAFAAERGLPLERDRFGNLYLTCRRGRPRGGPIVLEAHLDHPGFHVESVRRGVASLSFLGKMPAVRLEGQSLLVYSDHDPEPRAATIVRTAVKGDFYRPLVVKAEVGAGVEAGDFGVFDLPTWRLRGHRLAARAHDDLAQVAAVLATIDRVSRLDEPVNCIGLFTRAEEVGFIGAYGATAAGKLPQDAVVVALECSGLPLTRGFVVRCGDKTAVFDGWATTRLLELADAEAARDPSFLFTTPLPRRGTCNASLYAARGWVATGLTLPMENYHNWGDGEVRPEVIDLRDWQALVGFLQVICTRFGAYGDVQRRVRQRMDNLWRRERVNLRPKPARSALKLSPPPRSRR